MANVKMFTPEEIAELFPSREQSIITLDAEDTHGYVMRPPPVETVIVDTAVEELNFWRTMRKYQKLTNQMEVMSKLLAAMETQAKEYEAIIEAGLPEYDVDVEVKEGK